MPELPEVETTRRGLEPHVVGKRIAGVEVHQPRLRWPVPRSLARVLTGQRVLSLERRAKYLLFGTEKGCMLVHLGMSGSLRLDPDEAGRREHDRVEWRIEDGAHLRLRDPRRFGSVLWTKEDPLAHPLLANLGPEPLGEDLDDASLGEHLYRRSRARRLAVKSFIMDGRIVVGIGNIYAAEALFRAGIHPARPAGRISLERYQSLSRFVRKILKNAIGAGGTTLRDYVGSSGDPGEFEQELLVYGREGEDCVHCGRTLKSRVISQRASVYCPGCQR